MTLVRTNVLKDTIQKYVGIMKTFSKELGFAEQFKEERVGGLVCDFHGCPFSATIVKKTLESNRKYRTKMGERPRRSLHPFVL